jgi:hypothetical protein
MRKWIGLQVAVRLGLWLGMSTATAQAEEYYYSMIFGSQTSPKQLKYSHTWATFIRAVGEGPDLNTYALYVHTISWMPQAKEVHVLQLQPEPGVNRDLYQTLEVVGSQGQNVTMWGPFVIQKQVYDRSLKILEIIASGAPQYRAISTPRDLLVSDCIHAVAAVDPVFGRGHYPLIRIGKPASRYLARQFTTRSIYDQRLYNNAWLIPRLDLDRYPIEVVSPQQIPDRKCVLCMIPE